MTQMVDSRQQELGTDMIIKIAAENTDSPYPFKQAYLMVVAELGIPNTKLSKFGNTMFIVHPSDSKPGVGTFRALNADTAENFVQNCMDFSDKALQDGFYALRTQFSDPSILNMFKMIARQKEAEGNKSMGYAVNKGKDGDYVVTLILDNTKVGK